MFLLLGLGANIVNVAAAATTVLVAVKHAWDIYQAADAELQRRKGAE